MELRGYMVEVTFDGETLTAQGTNKASQMALRGPEHGDGPVQIPTGDIERIDFKQANPMVNGRVLVFTKAGQRYQLTFRRKDRDAFKELHEALQKATA